ncbi:MAG: hypothetical protein KJ621_03465 [Proteobacteria bacterium]|nr:hypothetical protein [Pseudomonadota bacterium]MBU1742491.1 hypothetical protein [Pseudomonadota bacterium]
MSPEAHQAYHNRERKAWRGQDNPAAKYTARHVLVARKLRSDGVPVEVIAARLSVPERTVYFWTTGGGWPHVKTTRPKPRPRA